MMREKEKEKEKEEDTLQRKSNNPNRKGGEQHQPEAWGKPGSRRRL